MLELVQISIGIFMHPAQKLCVAEQVCCVLCICLSNSPSDTQTLKDFIFD